MNLNSDKDVLSNNHVWAPGHIPFSHVGSAREAPSRSSSCEIKLEDAHTEICQKTQGGYGYDVGLHWRVLAAILYGIYTWFPLNTTSRIVGKLSRVPLPRFLRSPILRAYAWIFSARLEEAEFHNDLARYNSISQFFRRRLVPTARPVDPAACLVS